MNLCFFRETLPKILAHD